MQHIRIQIEVNERKSLYIQIFSFHIYYKHAMARINV